jgi:hypothetical protein
MLMDDVQNAPEPSGSDHQPHKCKRRADAMRPVGIGSERRWRGRGRSLSAKPRRSISSRGGKPPSVGISGHPISKPSLVGGTYRTVHIGGSALIGASPFLSLNEMSPRGHAAPAGSCYSRKHSTDRYLQDRGSFAVAQALDRQQKQPSRCSAGSWLNAFIVHKLAALRKGLPLRQPFF